MISGLRPNITPGSMTPSSWATRCRLPLQGKLWNIISQLKLAPCSVPDPTLEKVEKHSDSLPFSGYTPNGHPPDSTSASEKRVVVIRALTLLLGTNHEPFPLSQAAPSQSQSCAILDYIMHTLED